MGVVRTSKKRRAHCSKGSGRGATSFGAMSSPFFTGSLLQRKWQRCRRSPKRLPKNFRKVLKMSPTKVLRGIGRQYAKRMKKGSAHTTKRFAPSLLHRQKAGTRSNQFRMPHERCLVSTRNFLENSRNEKQNRPQTQYSIVTPQTRLL